MTSPPIDPPLRPPATKSAQSRSPTPSTVVATRTATRGDRRSGGGDPTKSAQSSWSTSRATSSARGRCRRVPNQERRRRPRQLSLPEPPTWGGRREGAGRKPSAERARPRHEQRPVHRPEQPVHVTLRARAGLPSFRANGLFSSLREALSAANRSAFRVIHFSIQRDHLHLIVEADSHDAFRSGVQGLASRCAWAVNLALGRRGRVLDHRYHAHALKTPREVRAALVYVLLNFRKHLGAPPGIDVCSSAFWFHGWSQPAPEPAGAPPVRCPRTWLAAVGWRRSGGPIDVAEAPAPLTPRRR